MKNDGRIRVLSLLFFLQLKQEKDWISDRYLKTYCYAAHYINALLADGYKFDKDNWNHIHFIKEVGVHSIARQNPSAVS